MAKNYNLQHWNNSKLKTSLIVFLCAIKNNIYLVYELKTPIATFQTRKVDNSLLFNKLATLPGNTRKGVGSFCLSKIEKYAKQTGCRDIICEVYVENKQALLFYEHRGYDIIGTMDTIKYKELRLKKEI